MIHKCLDLGSTLLIETDPSHFSEWAIVMRAASFSISLTVVGRFRIFIHRMTSSCLAPKLGNLTCSLTISSGWVQPTLDALLRVKFTNERGARLFEMPVRKLTSQPTGTWSITTKTNTTSTLPSGTNAHIKLQNPPRLHSPMSFCRQQASRKSVTGESSAKSGRPIEHDHQTYVIERNPTPPSKKERAFSVR